MDIQPPKYMAGYNMETNSCMQFVAVDEDTAEDRLFMLVRQATLACCPGCRPWMPADLGTTKVEMVLSFIIANTHVWAQIKSDATVSILTLLHYFFTSFISNPLLRILILLENYGT